MATEGIVIGQRRSKRQTNHKERARKKWRLTEEQVSEADLSTHVHLLGRSGMGKSWLMKHMLQTDIRNNAEGGGGLCLIDPDGDVFDFALACASEYPEVRRRLKIIDASRKDYFVGLNYLEYDPEIMSEASHAETVIAGITKAFGQENEGAKPRMERWFRLILIPLILERMTFEEVEKFAGSDPGFRMTILRKLHDEGLIGSNMMDAWLQYNELKPAEQFNQVESVLNRISKFTTARESRYIFCQQESTIDFRQAMDNREIVLCKLPKAQGYTKEELDLMGIIILDKIVQAGFSRGALPVDQRIPFRCYIDEFARYATQDIADGLDELRKYKVSFVLAHQRLNQLMRESPDLCDAVLTNCNVRIVFSVRATDAETMVEEMFTHELAQKQTKHVQTMLTVLPGEEETREIISIIDSESESEGTTESEGDAVGENTGLTEVTSSGASVAYGGDGSFLFQAPMTTTMLDLNASGTTSSSMRSHQRSSASSSSRTKGRAIGSTRVPFVPQQIVKQVTSVQHYSPEEKKAILVNKIVSQVKQEAYIQIGRNIPIPIKTTDVIMPDVNRFYIRRSERAAFEVNQSGRSVVAIEEEQKSRQKQIQVHTQRYLTGTEAVDAEFKVLDDASGGKQIQVPNRRNRYE
jgi:hypothetical protein